MSVFHHDDVDKEFVSWMGGAYDAGMSWITASIMLLAATHQCAGGHAAGAVARGIVLEVDPRLPPAIQRLAVDEAARVWAPYRVAVALRNIPGGASAEPEGAVLSVRLAVGAPGRCRRRARSARFVSSTAGRSRSGSWIARDRPGHRRQRRARSAGRAMASRAARPHSRTDRRARARARNRPLRPSLASTRVAGADAADPIHGRADRRERRTLRAHAGGSQPAAVGDHAQGVVAAENAGG